MVSLRRRQPALQVYASRVFRRAFGPEHKLVQVHSAAGLQRLIFDQPERPCAVRPPFGAQEQRVISLALTNAGRERVQMRNEENLYATVDQCGCDLLGNFRAFRLCSASTDR